MGAVDGACTQHRALVRERLVKSLQIGYAQPHIVITIRYNINVRCDAFWE